MRALIWDTETSGLVTNRSIRLEQQPHVIEFFAIDCDLENGQVYEEVEFLIKPPIQIESVITKLTTITNEQLSSQSTFKEVSDKIIGTLENASVVIAHNISFDCDMIEIECERLGRQIKWPRRLCTVEQTVGLLGHRLTLTKLYENLCNETLVGAHRARVDVIALKRCCEELYKLEMI